MTTELTNAKLDLANGFAPETLLQLAQDFRLRDLLELVMQRGLEYAHVKHAFAQIRWAGMRRDEVTDHRAPRFQNFRFV